VGAEARGHGSLADLVRAGRRDFVDSGNPFAGGLEVTRDGSHELSSSDAAATGYSIVSAESIEAAERLLEGCPYRTSVRLYEASAM
jgi:hypothetical protein